MHQANQTDSEGNFHNSREKIWQCAIHRAYVRADIPLKATATQVLRYTKAAAVPRRNGSWPTY
jgi:hypothetical protein